MKWAQMTLEQRRWFIAARRAGKSAAAAALSADKAIELARRAEQSRAVADKPSTFIKMPTNVDEASTMELLGFAWLKQNAPDRLTPEGRAREIAGHSEIVALIDALTQGEGDAVAFCSQNPDFNGLPNECVIVNASWTDWNDRHFRADTRVQCLRDAAEAMRAAARTESANA